MGSPDVKAIADQYCFIHSTFTRGKMEKGRWTYEPVKENEIHPGVQPDVKGQEIIYHTYYQWVWIFLAFQSILFYYPHWIWEKAEGGRIKMLVGDMNLPMLGDDKKAKQREKVKWYFSTNRGNSNKSKLQLLILQTVFNSRTILFGSFRSFFQGTIPNMPFFTLFARS